MKSRMDIDERIEALIQSVELLASFHRDTEAAMQKLDEKLTAQIGILAGHMTTLAQTMPAHERRIQGLETGQQ